MEQQRPMIRRRTSSSLARSSGVTQWRRRAPKSFGRYHRCSHGPEWRHRIRSTCSAYYALEAATGEKLWGQGLGGDVIT